MDKVEEIRKKIEVVGLHGESLEEDGKIKEEFKSFEYIKTIQSAMHAWKECNPKRAFILPAMGEYDVDGDKDARSVSVSLGGTDLRACQHSGRRDGQ